jgi:hypothetical protein
MVAYLSVWIKQTVTTAPPDTVDSRGETKVTFGCNALTSPKRHPIATIPRIDPVNGRQKPKAAKQRNFCVDETTFFSQKAMS